MSEHAYGREFLQEGLHQLDGVMVGRPDAKIAGITTIVAGVNGVFAGGTGRGKTELAEGLHELVHDIYDENVASLPIQNDLSGTQLIGGTSTFTKETTKYEEPVREVTTTELAGVLRKDTQVLSIDEFNRAPAKAMNSLLTALEKRKVTTLDGVRELPDLEYVIATMNPRETYEATSPIAHANISRFSVGAIFGRGADQAERVEIVKQISNMPKERKIEPITDLATIHAMRADAQKLEIPESLDAKLAVASVSISDALWEEVKLDDGEERLSVQIRKIARVMAVLASEPKVTEHGVAAAINMVLAARIGMAATNAVEIGPSLVKDILTETFN